jgi:membrane protein YqaA with SNARE-associated domain
MSTSRPETDATTKEFVKALFLALSVFFGSAGLAYVAFPKNQAIATIVGGIVGLILAIIVFYVLVAQAEEIARNARDRVETENKVHKGGVIGIIALNMAKLDEYYAINKGQAKKSFLASIAAICIGFLVILLSIRYSDNSGDRSRLVAGAISGVLLQFIGGAFFVMYNKSLDQLNLFYGKLVRLQDTMLAVQQCEKLDKKAIDRVREQIILELLHRHAKDVDLPTGKPTNKPGNALASYVNKMRGKSDKARAAEEIVPTKEDTKTRAQGAS